MRIIETKKIEELIKHLAVKANTVIRADILVKLKEACAKEKGFLAKTALRQIIENARIAKDENLAMCQDTGLPVVFVELGQEIFLKGNLLEVSINRGINSAYKEANFRRSIIQDPLRNRKDIRFTPAVIYTQIKKGNKIKIIFAPKGFGSENKSCVKMFNPAVEADEIIDFVVEAVKKAGPSACPPFIIGVGIGGTLDRAVILSKKALCQGITKSNNSSELAKLEGRMLKKINRLGLGPMGFGGKTTAIGVNILTSPTHIAGLPLAVSVGCHATRSAKAVL